MGFVRFIMAVVSLILAAIGMTLVLEAFLDNGVFLNGLIEVTLHGNFVPGTPMWLQVLASVTEGITGLAIALGSYVLFL